MTSSNYKRNLKISDKLIDQIAKRNAKAFEEVYEKASTAVFGYARSMLNDYDDATDVVQNTFISIYEHAKDYNPQNKAMAWIFTIARNHALTIIRNKKRHPEVNLDDLYDIKDESSVETDVAHESIAMDLLSHLKEDEREIVVMHAMSDMKHKDIAKTLNLPLSTVLSKYRRSIQKLKQFMEVNEYETS